MKNLYKSLAFAAIAAATLISCNKEPQPVEEPIAPTTSTAVFEFTTQVANPATKATLTPNAGDTEFTAAWSANDVMKLDATTNGTTYTGTAKWGGSSFTATISGVDPTESATWSYKATWPNYTESIPFGSARTQNGSAYNSQYDIMSGELECTGVIGKNGTSDLVIPMDRLTGIAYFHITGGPEGENVLSAKLEAANIAAETVSVDANGDLVVPNEKLDEINLTINGNLSAEDFALWFNVLPGSYSSLTLSITTDGGKTATINASNLTYTAGKLNKAKLDGVLNWNTASVFHESFDKCDGTGGNDGSWSGSIASSEYKDNTMADMPGWTLVKGNAANKAIKLASGSAKGSATTPALGITSETATLTLRAGAWNSGSENTRIMVSVIGNGESSVGYVDLTKGEFNEYEIVLGNGVDANTKVKFESEKASNNRFFIDDVKVVAGGDMPVVETLTVTPDANNPETVSYEGGVLNYTVTTNIASWEATSNNEAFVVETVSGGFKVTVDENESSSPRTAIITVAGGSITQTVSITQAAAPATIQTITIAEFLNKAVGTDWYRLTGKVSNITSTQYGNFTITDATGSVYVYGLTKTQQAANDKSFSDIGLVEGDIVTIIAQRAVYQGNPQTGGPAYYESHRKPGSLTLSPTALTFDAAGEEKSVVATTANFTGFVTITASSDNNQFSASVSDNTITITAAANTGSAQITGTVTITATDGTDTDVKTVSLTQNKPVPAAQNGDVLWQEDFTGYETVPSSATGTHVYAGGTVTYTLTDGASETKLFNDNLASGTAPELLVAKTNGSFKVSGIPTGSATTATLTFKTNYDYCTIIPSSGVSIIENQSSFNNKIKVVVLSISNGKESFDLEIKNTKSSNTRVDDLQLTVGEPPAPTLSSITVSGQKSSFTVGDTFEFGGTVTATYSNGTTADVTSNAEFSGYNMSAAGSQTVNVSYTENNVTETTSYSISVSEGGAPNQTTVKLTVGTNGGTWNNGVQTSSASVGDVTFTALVSSGNDGKYYSSDNSWRFYSAGSSGVKITVPSGKKITTVIIKWKTGVPVTPSGFTASGSSSPTTYTSTGSVSEVSFVRNNNSNLLIQEITVTYE